MKTIITCMLLSASTAAAQDSAPAEGTTETAVPAKDINLLDGGEASDANAQESEDERVSDSEETEAGPTLEVTVVLKNGVSLAGTVSQTDLLSWSPGSDLMFTPNGGTASSLPGANIASVTQAGATAAPPTVTVNIAKEPEEPESTYRSPNGFRHPNPATSRYLYAPSAINMEAGQGYISQKLVFTSIAYAPTDNFTLLFGTFTPFPPAISVFGGKYSFDINENLKASVGGEAFVFGLDQQIPVAIGFGALTYGNEDKHITVASGYAAGDFFNGPQVPLMVAGQLRTSEGVALITENWFLFDTQSIAGGNLSSLVSANINSIAFRLVGRRDRGDGVVRGMRTKSGHPKTTWDLGFAAIGFPDGPSEIYNEATGTYEPTEFSNYTLFGPMPWIDWTWHFGEAKN